MAMQKREKVLGAATGVLLVVAVVYYFFSGGGDSDSLGSLRRQHDNLDTEVKDKQLQAKSLQKYEQRLDGFEKRSLPPDHDLARSLYQKWLRKLISSQAGFDDVNVTPAQGQRRRDSYWKFGFVIRGQGTLDQLTKFLYGFYSVDHLHKIVHLTANPLGDSKELDLMITVEALSLPGAKQTDKLSTEPANRLVLSDLEEYRKAIVRRRMERGNDRVEPSGGLFASYVPVRPPPPPRQDDRPPEPRPPAFDESRHTYVTATLEVNGQPQVWINIRTSGKRLQLSEGDTFELGPLSCTIVQIEPRRRSVTIEIDGQRHRIRLGDSLQQILEVAHERV